MILRIALPLALVVSACGHFCPKPKPAPPIAVEVTALGCVDFPPPFSFSDHSGFDGAEEGCPEAWETCLTFAAQGRLNRYLSDLQTWSNQAWLGCAKTKDIENATPASGIHHDPDIARPP